MLSLAGLLYENCLVVFQTVTVGQTIGNYIYIIFSVTFLTFLMCFSEVGLLRFCITQLTQESDT